MSQHTVYRMTPEAWVELHTTADGRCMMCHRECERLQVDHDHAVGYPAVRGLVCAKCNTALSRMETGSQPWTGEARAFVATPWHQRMVERA